VPRTGENWFFGPGTYEERISLHQKNILFHSPNGHLQVGHLKKCGIKHRNKISVNIEAKPRPNTMVTAIDTKKSS